MPPRSSPMLQSYSEFLASSFGNFTQTYFADHSELWSHDQINRPLRSQKWTPGRRGSTCAIRFHSATRAIYSLTTLCSTSDILISLKWYDDSGAATPTQ